MGNPNDNSELFEIFQNQVDLEEEQEQEKERANESDDEDEPEEENEEAETEEEKETETDQLDHRSSTSDPEQAEPEPSTPSNRSASASSKDPTSQEPQTQSPPSSEQPKTPSSTVAPDDENDPDTETGSFIKELEEEKELEGKIILSRGTSVFLLLLAFSFIIGSYFLGTQTGSNQVAVRTNTDNETSQEVEVPVTDPDETPSSDASSGETNNQNNTGPISDDQKEQETAQKQPYYTFAIISYKSTEPNVEKYINKHINALKNDAGLNQVGFLPANYSWNNQHWIVAGVMENREKAENVKQNVRSHLDRTQHADDYNADIVKLSSTQKENIRFPN